MNSWLIRQAIIRWIQSIGFILLLFGAVTAHSATPTVTTESASEMTQNSAKLCATVSPNGDSTTVFFSKTLCVHHGETLKIAIGGGTKSYELSADLGKLADRKLTFWGVSHLFF
jgi:hypothetical protein